MAGTQQEWRDEQIELIISRLLRVGVTTAAVVVLVSGFAYLLEHGQDPPNFKRFHGQPAELRTLSGMLGAVRALQPRALIQLGLLILVATPVARVIFSLIAFLRQRDWLYVVITTVVLGVLLVNLFSGAG